MSSVIRCIMCRHYRLAQKCNAFPNGIPKIILLGKNDHKKPFKGDNGIQFEPVKELTNSKQRGKNE